MWNSLRMSEWRNPNRLMEVIALAMTNRDFRIAASKNLVKFNDGLACKVTNGHRLDEAEKTVARPKATIANTHIKLTQQLRQLETQPPLCFRYFRNGYDLQLFVANELPDLLDNWKHGVSSGLIGNGQRSIQNIFFPV